MKRYRLGYDFAFYPRPSITYNGEVIGGMSIDVVFRIYGSSGEEMLFGSDDIQNQQLETEKGSVYVQHLLLGYFDQKDIYRLKPNVALMEKHNLNLTIQWDIHGYSKEIGTTVLDQVFIEESEFTEIMRVHADAFDHEDNRPVETTSFFKQEIMPN